jgi:hypothetical protein
LGPPPVDEDRRRTARHEGAHAAAAHPLGWEVTGVDLDPNGGGGCDILAPPSMTSERRVAERAVIAAAAQKHVGWVYGPAYDNDRKMIAEARGYARDRLAAAAYDHASSALSSVS